MSSGFPADGIPLERIRAGAVNWSGELPRGQEYWSAPALVFEAPPRAELRLSAATEGRLHLTGYLASRLRLECRRCLEGMTWPLEVDLDLWFDASLEPWDEADGVFGFDAGEATLDIARPLREEVLLALPEYPVCREDCRGLCPTCGRNLNENECDCTVEEIDPRWAVLRERVRGE
jgi:uncharacterized protein